MKILFLSPVLPSEPKDGDRLRAFYLLKGLSHRHQVTLLSFYSEAKEKDELALSPLRRFISDIHLIHQPRGLQRWQAARHFFSALPFNVGSCWNPQMASTTQELVERQAFDAAIAYRLKTAPYVLAIKKEMPKLIDFTDSMGRYWEERLKQGAFFLKRPIWRMEWQKLKRYEALMAASFEAGLINSQIDRQKILQGAPDARLEVLANGVDFNWFKPAPKKKQAGDAARLVFVGAMNYPPNEDAVLRFYKCSFPLLKKRFPLIQLWIVGNQPGPKLRALQQGDPAVQVTGYVADTRPFVWEADVAICPVAFGAGRQNKVLEAFALGTPVVASSLAANGVEAAPGKQLLVADDPELFANHIACLLSDAALAKKISRQALSFVRMRYNWNSSVSKLEGILKELVKRSR